MTHRLATNCAKNYCNQTSIVKVIVENVVTCFFWDTVYKQQRPSIIFNYSLLIDSGKHSQSDSNDERGVHVYNQGASCTTSKAKASSNTTL